MKQELPILANQCTYDWPDIINSLFSVFFCGGDCIEDLGTNFKDKLNNNPYVKIPSPDRVLDRLKELSIDSFECETKRGKAIHTFSTNPKLNKLNVSLLEKLNKFEEEILTIDYDNTIVFTEKADSKMTYKRDYGYQPGVAMLNSENILFVENRNGNSDARSFQKQTLKRMFDLIEDKIKGKTINFRADAASYLFDVVGLLKGYEANFYIGAKTTILLSHIKSIEDWEKSIDNKGEVVFISEIPYTPFKSHLSEEDCNKEENQYRLIVKKKQRPDGQINVITGEAFDYTSILTNDKIKSTQEAIDFYNKRGAIERQFDVMKNEFGWNNLPFSKLEQNTVFLILMAICRNLYGDIIETFSKKYEELQPQFRLKKFIFRFIMIPATWIRSSRQNILSIYGKLHFKT